MKLSPPTLVTALCWSYRLAAASNSHVYTIDTPAALSEERLVKTELSPEIARYVLAQRTGVEDYHDVEVEYNSALQAINAFGAREDLFGKRKVENVLILVEGQDAELSLLDKSSHVTISPSPSANATRGLFLDLARQALPEYLNNLPDDEVYILLKGGANQRGEQRDRRIAIWSEKELQAYIKDNLPKASETSLSITIITTPSSYHHGEKGADYGTYGMPAGAQSPLRKRQQPAAEEPLEVEPTTVPVTHNTIPVSSLANESEPLPGILPACFSSLSACESTTRNCSGHGSCSKKYSDPNSADGSRFKDCYACQCSATVKDLGKGSKSTTYWGGPACQKRDVSVQFWLIALFSIALVGLISFAVGQIWSMGDQELPSVIGAGVSGPVKRS